MGDGFRGREGFWTFWAPVRMGGRSVVNNRIGHGGPGQGGLDEGDSSQFPPPFPVGVEGRDAMILADKHIFVRSRSRNNIQCHRGLAPVL